MLNLLPGTLPIHYSQVDNDVCTVLQYDGSIHPCLQQEPHVPEGTVQ